MNGGAIEIRHATEADLALVQRFIHELADYERLRDDCTGTLADLRETLFGAKARAEVLLAFADGEPAGFAVYFFAYSTFAARPLLYLEDLFVRPELRRRKVGLRLMEELEQIARANRCARIDWTVLDWNQDAIGFYEALGAEPHRAWIKYSLSLAKLPDKRS